MAKTKLIYAVEMLHYLPLFIAHERELRDMLDLELASAPYGDKSAIQSLMSSATKDQDVHFCVCDPMMVSLKNAYAAVGGDEPVAIAQLIGKVPFWAVDHKDVAFNDEKCFERFSQIFAYPEPNTGYIFGKLVHAPLASTRGNSLQLRTKEINDELDLYLNGSSATVVIEADMLKIRKFTETSGNQIVYSFAQNREYRDFCFTAVLTHKGFLRSQEGREEARRLVSALVRAADLIYTYPELAAAYAVSIFDKYGYSRDIIVGALAALRKDNVFSRSPVINQSGWQKSGYIRRKVGNKFEFPSFRRFVDNRIAKKAFSSHVRTKATDSKYLLTNLSPFASVFLHGVLPVAVFAAMYLLPGFFSIIRHGLPSVLENHWMLFHFLVTTAVLTIYSFRARISHQIKKDPAKWLEWGIGIFVAYGIAETGIIEKLIGALSEK